MRVLVRERKQCRRNRCRCCDKKRGNIPPMDYSSFTITLLWRIAGNNWNVLWENVLQNVFSFLTEALTQKTHLHFDSDQTAVGKPSSHDRKSRLDLQVCLFDFGWILVS